MWKGSSALIKSIPSVLLLCPGASEVCVHQTTETALEQRARNVIQVSSLKSLPVQQEDQVFMEGQPAPCSAGLTRITELCTIAEV